MARNSNLKFAAVKTQATSGRADRPADTRAETSMAAKRKLAVISRHVKALKRQLQANTEGLKYAPR
jgi:hypothetical protein